MNFVMIKNSTLNPVCMTGFRIFTVHSVEQPAGKFSVLINAKKPLALINDN